ncbi:Mrx3 protein [Saccharomycopsis crataegensis]|uniref:Mrx3 protein n=1 Tax=Saccharomycopsis crataegensis TaxID=43959 RepID=A0AAV5QWW1_9ASCO|nr:Mrx3 protein [Saccharomycopsis crataegensis]
MSAVIRKGLGSFFAFATGYSAIHSNTVPDYSPRGLDEQKQSALDSIRQSSEYKALQANSNFHGSAYSLSIPSSYRQNHVAQGVLYGQNYFEIDPLVYVNENDGELVAFYHIGDKLTDQTGKLHHGVLGLLLDEALCFCGFPKLPHKRGVTGKLTLDYEDSVCAGQTVVLKAKVTEHQGRKAVIDGHIETLDQGNVLAKGRCVLVEPKWFKYVDWFDLFRQ